MTNEVSSISEDKCYELLRKYRNGGNDKLISFSVLPASRDLRGFVGEYFILNMKTEKEPIEGIQFFVKTLSKNKTLLEYCKTGKMFGKEIACYKFLEKLEEEPFHIDIKFVPKFYIALNEDVVILEDVTKKGFKVTEGFNIELDFEHIKVALRSLARFHGASLIYEEIKSTELGRKFRLTEEFGEWLEESCFRKDTNYLGYRFLSCGVKGVKALVDLLPEDSVSAEEFKTKLDSLFERCFEIIEPNQTFRNVWSHGDLWTKNLMFRYENGKPMDCLIFDFQLQRYSPPSSDVLFLIYQTTDRTMRQKYLHRLLDYYFETLTDELAKFKLNIEEILPRDEFENSIVVFLPWVKLIKAIYRSLSAMNKDYSEKLHSNDYYIFNDRSELIREVFNCQQSYKDVMVPVLEDLRGVLTREIISIEDCYKIIEKKLGTTEYNLLEYKFISLNEKLGFLGEHCKLRIKLLTKENDTIELKFFVKEIPTKEKGKDFVENNNIYYKETKFYTKIVPMMNENGITSINECLSPYLLARLNDVLVFDDYSEKGYEMLNARKPYNFETVAIGLRKLAKFHASGLILEEKLSTADRKFRLNRAFPTELQESLYNHNEDGLKFIKGIAEGILTHIDLFPDPKSTITQEQFKKRAQKFMYNINQLALPSKKFRNTICHGDLWCNNMLFKFENHKPVDCIFVDFQFVRYLPPAHDVISFLYLVTDRKFRAQHMQNALDMYYREISAVFEANGVNGKNVLNYEEFLDSCQDMKMFSILQSVDTLQNAMLTSDQIKELLSDTKLSGHFYFEDRGPFLAKICAQDTIYNDKMCECVRNLSEICENVPE